MTERPIRSAEEDTLGRAPFAAAIAAHVVSDAFAEGGAVGLCGPWGSGKSSILALVEEQLRERPDDAAVVVRFNPWLFAGAEQLVARFFFELSAQLRTARERRLLRLADALETYGTLVEPAAQLPVAGSWLGLAARTAVTSGGWLKRRNGARASLEEQRDRLRDHLTRLGRRLVVVVDDVDRLRSDEIRDVVRLVRLTGSFPQMVYLLAFDRTRVEQALDETGTSGRAYLEKIMQVIHDVPALPPQRLRSAVSDELHRAWEAAGASGDPAVEFFEQLTAIDTVDSVCRSLRDVKRIVAALGPALSLTQGTVHYADVTALEAIRIYLPDVFARLAPAVDALTYPLNYFGIRPKDEDAEAPQRLVDELLAAAGSQRETVLELCRRLFPASAPYVGEEPEELGPAALLALKRDRRVAVKEVLLAYLEQVGAEGITATSELEVLEVVADEEQLRAMLASLPDERLRTVVDRLGWHIAEIDSAAVPGCMRVLSAEARRLLLGWGNRGVPALELLFTLLTVRLPAAERVATLEELELAASTWLALLRGLRAALERGQEVVAAEDLERLEHALAEAVAREPADELRTEWDVFELLAWLADRDEGRAAAARAIEDDDVLLSVLASAVRRESPLRPWRIDGERLTAAFGAETVSRRVRELRARTDGTAGGAAAVLELAAPLVH